MNDTNKSIDYYIILANFKRLLNAKLISTEEYAKLVSHLDKKFNK